MNPTYLTCAETAKLLRIRLKAVFPRTKFGVRSHVYSGGASIYVKWVDGPTTRLVDATAQQFAGGGFDGMIDMAYSVSHWLLPDGTTRPAHSDGTTGSMGTVPPVREWMPDPECKLVRFGAKYVFCNRDYSAAFIRRVCDRLAGEGFPQFQSVEIDTSYSASAWIKDGRRPLDGGDGPDMGTMLHRTCARFMIAA
jgi:hypothetical protein